MIRRFNTRIYPTKTQAAYFQKCFGIRRFAYNWGLEHWNQYKSWTKLDTAWNNDFVLHSQKPYLKEVNSMIKTQAFKDLHSGFKKYYEKSRSNAPQFKTKKKDSNRFSMFMKSGKRLSARTIYFVNKRISLLTTKQIGRFNLKSSENLEFLNNENIRICEWTISEKNDKYYISICYEKTNPNKVIYNQPFDKIGIDAGMKTMMTCYDSREAFEFNLPHKIIRLEHKIDNLQQIRDRKQYGSIRYNHLKKQISNCYEKIANIKKDYMCKLADALTLCYKQINFESFSYDLSFKKGRRKIARLAPKTFLRILEQKCSERGCVLNIIENQPTTQTCSHCGHRYVKTQKLTVLDRVYKCECCNLEIERDINSAINIYNIA